MDENKTPTDPSPDDVKQDEYEDVGDFLAVTRNGRAKVTESNTGHG